MTERKHIVGMLVKDEPGVLAKISGLFSRRGFNIDTIVIGKTNLKGVSHIVASLNADDRTIEQLDRQVGKMIDVIKLADFNEQNAVVREHCLAKAAIREKDEIEEFCKKHGAKILHKNHSWAVLELCESPKKIDDFVKELQESFGIKELSRTGINALQKE